VVDVVLRDGSTVRIRPVRPDDVQLIEDFLIALSPESRHMRFWTASIDVAEIAKRTADVDYEGHMTLLALTGEGDDARVLGGSQYQRIDDTRAEFSISIADEMQGKGLGSLLLVQLAQAASENGIPIFTAEVLPENHRMIHVFRETGFNPSIRAKPGVIDVEFPTTITPEAIDHVEERQAAAAITAMEHFLSPDTIAVIGASRNPSSIGGRLFRNLLDGRFHGAIYPVNPSADSVQGVPAFKSLLEVPAQVDTAFICVPSKLVLGVVKECAEKGVHGVVVITSGFAEIGGDGVKMQEELVTTCRRAGMRLIGPNCMGIINTDPEIGMNGNFGTANPMPGHVGFMSQSGALGLAVMEYATQLGLGLSSFVSIGNKGDISGNDLLCYWEQDPNTDVILLYLESMGNPRRFARITRRVGHKKPIVVVKSGRGKAGKRATASHTGSLLAASEVTVDALFHQSGVIRTDTLEEMFDTATLLAHQPPPRGNRVAIITNAGGLGIMCADASEANGLAVPSLAEETVKELRSFLPSEASVANPVDMIASSGPEDYTRAIRVIGDDPGIDAVIVLYIPIDPVRAVEMAHAIVEGIQSLEGRVPALTAFMSEKGLPPDLRGESMHIPSFRFPEQAAMALAKAVQYGTWREKDIGDVPDFDDVRQDEAAGILAQVLKDGDGWLTPEQLEGLFACYGLPTARSATVETAKEAGAAAGEIGTPVALKAVGADIVHKTEVGAVKLGLVGADEVEAAALEMADSVAAHGLSLEGFSVQQMVEGGVEMLVGVFHDKLFGPVVMCGAGGTAVELVKDVSVRITPLTDVDATEMIRSLKTFPLLDGYRGAPKADIAALEDLVLRVSAMVENHPEIAEMDCNPVMVLGTGAVIVDARIRVEQPPPPSPLAARVRV
jgi:acetyl coenzyme A synthetase (ADP forming)-like protein